MLRTATTAPARSAKASGTRAAAARVTTATTGEQIAKQLGGVTRNAVIGKVHRLGLSGRATPSKPQRTTFKAPRPAREASPRGANEGRSGPSTEELSVIETESSLGKSGWSRRVKVVAASVGALAVGFSVWALGHRATGAGPVSSSPLTLESSALPAPVAPPPAPLDTGAEPLVKPSTPLPQTIELRLGTRPAEVEVWLGDRKLGSSAAPLQLPRAAEPIELRARWSGLTSTRTRLARAERWADSPALGSGGGGGRVHEVPGR